MKQLIEEFCLPRLSSFILVHPFILSFTSHYFCFYKCSQHSTVCKYRITEETCSNLLLLAKNLYECWNRANQIRRKPSHPSTKKSTKWTIVFSFLIYFPNRKTQSCTKRTKHPIWREDNRSTTNCTTKSPPNPVHSRITS